MEHPIDSQDTDLLGGHSQPQVIKRELDSMDDFEHLEDGGNKEQASAEEISSIGYKVENNLLEMGDSFPESRQIGDLLGASFPDPKVATKTFMEVERDIYESPKKTAPEEPKPSFDHLEHYSDSDSEPEPFKQAKEFEPEPEAPSKVVDVQVVREVVVAEESLPKKPEPEAPPTVTKETAPVKEPVRDVVETKKTPKIEVEIIFCKMGLDAWFHPERLDPKVESLIYWRDPKKSGPVFGGVLVVLLALTYFSLISVVAYISLLALTGTISFRVYKTIVQAIQKTGDGHPFKEILEKDISLPQDKVKEVSEVAVAHINAAVSELRRLFLVEDLVDSIKFGVLLWCFTYLGSWFNGMTLIIIAWVALFTLPKVYEMNKTQIDKNLEVVRAKLAEITSKVKAAIPIGKKPEEKKEQ